MEQGQLDALNFEVKAIETFLGYEFKGVSIEDKQVFASKYKEERRAWTSNMLDEAYVQYVAEREGSE